MKKVAFSIEAYLSDEQIETIKESLEQSLKKDLKEPISLECLYGCQYYIKKYEKTAPKQIFGQEVITIELIQVP